MKSLKEKISMPIDEFTSPCDGWVEKSDNLKTALDKMLEGGYRHLPVLDEGNPVGILSSRDLIVLDQLDSKIDVTVDKIMTESPYTVVSGSPLEEVAFEMSSRKIGSAIVINDSGKIEGIFTTTDALNALVEILRGEY